MMKKRTVNLRCWLCETCTLELCAKHVNDPEHKGHNITYIGKVPTEIQVHVKSTQSKEQS